MFGGLVVVFGGWHQVLFFTNGPQVSVHEFATLSMNGFDGESHPVFWPRLFLKRYTDV